ncbi:MAG: AAA family ATPase [Methylococcales bacterium]
MLRVQVPDFRVLKDIDITFEQSFSPNVFPLGSLNGGGKSTLLQLIFILLHCSAHSERHQFIINMLERVTIPEGENSKLLARFEFIDESNEKIELEFTLCNDDYLRELDIDPIFNKEVISFDVFLKEKELISERVNKGENEEKIKRGDFSDQYYDEDSPITVADHHKELRSRIEIINRLRIEKINKRLKTIQPLLDNLSEFFTLKNQYYITSYSCNDRATGLVCQSLGVSHTTKDIQAILTIVSKQVFLSAPSTQIYLFLPKEANKLLFKKLDLKRDHLISNYESKLDEVKNKIPNFLTFDVFAVDIVVALIEHARNQDFKTLVNTNINGTSYQKIMAELNLLTQDKKVQPQLDENAAITGIVFKTNDGIEIYPEDLSHGELKRLSIYVWLKTLPKGENIVLMDEIENALHPDWQYQIVRDLVEWGKDNQYILATHSYGLCEALTPAHVKELEPKLMTH